MRNKPMTILEIAGALRRKEVSVRELVEDSLNTIQAKDDKLLAFESVLSERALKVAEERDKELAQGLTRGPLHGVPVVIKDNIELEGTITTASSKWRKDTPSSTTATVAQRLEDAGAVIVGKVRLHEFAYGVITPPTRNPWSYDHSPGGSSGGSAAAVAAGMCVASLGTDTGCSVRIPAALTNLVGIRPTFGRVPRHGVISLAWSMDTVGPIARTAVDTAIMLGVIAGHDPRDPSSADQPVPDYLREMRVDMSSIRIGVPTTFFFDRIDPEVKAAVERALSELENLGATLVPVEIPDMELSQPVSALIHYCEAIEYHHRLAKQGTDLYEDDVQLLIELGAVVPALWYNKALRARGQITRRIKAAMDQLQLDMLATPTSPFTASRIGQLEFEFEGVKESVIDAFLRYTQVFSLTGFPAASVPVGFSSEGLPIGMQLVGRPFQEGRVLGVAHAYQTVTDWHTRQPEAGA